MRIKIKHLLGISMCLAVLAAPSMASAAEWTLQKTPSIPEATGSTMKDVSCSSETACTLVGQYVTTASNPRLLAERWNGTEWILQSVGVGLFSEGILNGVTCIKEKWCIAVGNTRLGKPIAATWNGTSWSVKVVENQGVPLSGVLLDVSCTTEAACTAVGGESGEAIAVRWNGQYWKKESLVNPGKESEAVSISCTLSTSCVTVGHYTDGAGKVQAFAERWEVEGVWMLKSLAKPAETTSYRLDSVSCATYTQCTAVGRYSTPAGSFRLAEEGPLTWKIQTVGTETSADLRGVSCKGSGGPVWCMAVGFLFSPSSNLEAAISNWGSPWSLLAFPKESLTVAMQAVSCPSTLMCESVANKNTTNNVSYVGMWH